MSHTPGPWEWEDGWDTGMFADDDGEGCEKYIDCRLRGANKSIVIPIRVDHFNWEFDAGLYNDAISRDDRNLIAAAPEMLKVLEEIFETTDSSDDCAWCHRHRDMVIDVIAKAKGEVK